MRRFKSVFRNISYTVTSNLVVLIVSSVVTLFLPKVLGVSDYGHYQLYLFYVSYVGFLHFGWCDGIYLRYGGEDYNTLDKRKLKGQFYSLLLFQLSLTFIFLMILFFQKSYDSNKSIVMYMVVANILILNLRNFILLTLQATNRIKDYSIVVILDRLFFLFSIIILLLGRTNEFKYFIYADILAKIVSFIIALKKLEQVTFLSRSRPIFDIKESIENIKAGMNLMFANIASTLIIGIVRFGVQYKWDVETFGKISLTLSISNLLMVFVNAISLAIFPLLKKVKESKYRETYPLIRTALMPIVFLLLLLYYPLTFILGKWLPQYILSLKFMAIAFPIVVFDSKVGLLSNTFLKAMRKEKEIFKVNFITAILSLMFTFVTVILFENIVLTVLSIVILVAIRSTLAEIVLGRELSVTIYKDILLEFLLVALFIIAGWYFSGVIGMFLYGSGVIVYLLIKKQELICLISKLIREGKVSQEKN